MKQANGLHFSAFIMVFAVLGSLCAAQQVGNNVNVLPSYGEPNPTNRFLGDGYLQRQVEPSIAASSRNPDHLLAAFIDFRAVDDKSGDTPPGDAMDAWIGLSRSFDRGRTWFGSMVPGFPTDTSAAGMSSPMYNQEAGGDPVVAAGTNGRFYLGGMFFDRKGISNIVVVLYEDFPDRDGGENIRYLGAAIVDKGSMSPSGNFNDKPIIVADIPRGKKAKVDNCGNVYMAYTIFHGGTTAPFHSKLGFARSAEGSCGKDWEKPKYLNKNWPQNQGAAMAVDPKTGKIYVVWRHFKTPDGFTPSLPDALLMVTSSDGGATFTDPIVIAQGDVFHPFDQTGISTEQNADLPTFRTNAYPSIAVDGSDNSESGNMFVAIQERTESGSPRIAVWTLPSGATSWTKRFVESSVDSNAHQVMPALSFGGGQLRVMWYDFREASQDSYPVDSNSPATEITNTIGVSAALNSETGLMSGFDRMMNVRLAQAPLPLKEIEGNLYPDFSASVQLSQYYIDAYTGRIAEVPSLPGVPAVNRPNLPMYAGGVYAFASDYISLVPAVQFVPDESGKLPWRWTYKSTDYAARSSFGIWYDTRDVVFPTQGLSGDTSKNNLTDPMGWQTYGPPGTGQVSCQNPGARNANVYMTEIKPGIVVGSHSLYRQLVDGNGSPIQRALPMYVENPNGAADVDSQSNPYGSRFFRLTILPSNDVAGSFVAPAGSAKTNLDLEILPFSSATATVFVYCPGCNGSNRSKPITVKVEQIYGPINTDTGKGGNLVPDGLTGAITFNGDPSSPDVVNIDLPQREAHGVEVTTPQYGNPQYGSPQYGSPQYGSPQYGSQQVSSPQYASPQYASPQYGSPQYGSPQYSSPQYGSTPIGDFTWKATNAGNNTSAYTSVTYIATNPENYNYQVILWRKHETPIADCDGARQKQDQVISIIPNPQYSSPQYGSPQYGSPQYGSPQYSSAQYADATFSVAPASGSQVSQMQTKALSQKPPAPPSGVTEAPRTPDEVYITLRVFATEGTESPFAGDEGAAARSEFLQRVTQVVTPEAPDTDKQGIVEPVICVGEQPCRTIVFNKTNTTTTISIAPEPSALNQNYTVEVTVAPAQGGGTPGGSVNVSDGVNSCTIDLVAGAGSCELPSDALGTRLVTATYSGDDSFNFSAASATHTVASPVVTSIVPSTAAAGYGQMIAVFVDYLPRGCTTPQIWFNQGSISEPGFYWNPASTLIPDEGSTTSVLFARLPFIGDGAVGTQHNLSAGPASVEVHCVGQVTNTSDLAVSTVPGTPAIRGVLGPAPFDPIDAVVPGQEIYISAYGIDTSEATVIFRVPGPGTGLGGDFFYREVPATTTQSAPGFGTACGVNVPADLLGFDAVQISVKTTIRDGAPSAASTPVSLPIVTSGAIRVPTDYQTIQDAIDAAADGGFVLVSPGTYSGSGNTNLDFGGKDLELRSTSGPASTIIDCQDTGLALHFHSNETTASIVRGFTVQNCRGMSHAWSGRPSNPPLSGGAIVCDGASPTLVGNVFVGNIAELGGAIAAFNCPNLQILDNQFMTNESILFHGGAVYELNSGGLISRNRFTENSAPSGGGGAIALQQGSSPTVEANLIQMNSAFVGGGGMLVSNGAPRLANNVVIKNNVTGTAAGPLYWHGGGALRLWGVDGLQSVNNTYALNSAAVRGGAIYVAYTDGATFVNDIFGENIAGGGNNNLQIAEFEESTHFPSVVNVDYSLWDSGSYNIVESGCTLNSAATIQGNPAFVDISNGDFHLTPTSPAIDSGTSTRPGIAIPQTDFDGDTRPQGTQTDIGADEFVDLPDLVVSSIDALPASVTRGGYAGIGYTVRNEGAEGPAGDSVFDVAMYLSQDQILDEGDIQLVWGYSAWNYHLSLDWQASYSNQVLFDDSIPLGTYYLIVVADANPGQPPNYYPGVAEANETNNWTVSDTQIVVQTPVN